MELEQLSCGDFCGRFSVFRLGGLVSSVGEFVEGFVALSQHFSFGICAGPGGTTFFLEEGFWGVFRRWSICFMVSRFFPEQRVQVIYRFSAHSGKGISP